MTDSCNASLVFRKIVPIRFIGGCRRNSSRWHTRPAEEGVQKIITECKLDGIEVPRFRTIGNSLSLEFEAPRDRIVTLGGQTDSPDSAIVSNGSNPDKCNSDFNGPSGKTGESSLTSDKPSDMSDKPCCLSDKTQLSVESSPQRTDKAESVSDKSSVTSDKQSPSEDERPVAETQVLQFIGAHGEVRSTEIADLLGATQRSATRFLGRLVERGLVETSGVGHVLLHVGEQMRVAKHDVGRLMTQALGDSKRRETRVNEQAHMAVAEVGILIRFTPLAAHPRSRHGCTSSRSSRQVR